MASSSHSHTVNAATDHPHHASLPVAIPAQSSSSLATSWPSPSQTAGSLRRPSWQGDLSSTSWQQDHHGDIGQLQRKECIINNDSLALPPSYSSRSHPANGRAKITFTSPFAAVPSAPLSPPLYTSNTITSSISYTSLSSTASSLFSPASLSSPGPLTPDCATPLTPFEVAFRKQCSVANTNDDGVVKHTRSQYPANTSNPPADWARLPLSPRAALSAAYTAQGSTLPFSPFSSNTPSNNDYNGHASPLWGAQSPPCSPTAPVGNLNDMPSSLSARERRRRSVDVGMLGNARGHERSGRTSHKDASFVPPDQLRARRADYHHRSRDSLFAQHLTSILSHSLSLCSAGIQEHPYENETDYSASTTNCSPRSSLSSEVDDDTSHPSSTSSALSSVAAQTMSNKPHTNRPAESNSIPSTPQLGRRRSTAPCIVVITPARRNELIHMMASWSFNSHELDQDELCECACMVFECVLQMQGIDESIEMTRLRSLVISLRSAYHSRNAYHNFSHATDVLQAIYAFLVELGIAPPLQTLLDSSAGTGKWKRASAVNEPGRIGDIMRPMDVFALLVAAIGHDVGHPGLSNAYMVNARTPAAQVYQDKSVLENFHSVTLARMLKLHGFTWLLEADTSGTDFRQVMLAAVLATDMSRHFAIVSQLNELGSRLKASNFVSDRVAEDRLLICSGLMKCGDISNPTRPHHVARQWSTALLEEWAVQAKIEAQFKLPISVIILDPREKVAQAKSQVGFINLFTQPLFDAVASVQPAFIRFADYCREGRAVWDKVVAEGETATASTPPAGPAPMSRRSSSQTTPTSRTPASTPVRDVRPVLASPSLPVSRGFLSRLPPHRMPRLKSIDPLRANALNASSESNLPNSASSASTYSMVSPAASLFERNGSMSSVTTTSSWLSPSTVDDCLTLGDEQCEGNCQTITAACAYCSRRAQQEQQAETGIYGSPLDDSVWPPDPFRPRPQKATGF